MRSLKYFSEDVIGGIKIMCIKTVTLNSMAIRVILVEQGILINGRMRRVLFKKVPLLKVFEQKFQLVTERFKFIYLVLFMEVA